MRESSHRHWENKPAKLFRFRMAQRPKSTRARLQAGFKPASCQACHPGSTQLTGLEPLRPCQSGSIRPATPACGSTVRFTLWAHPRASACLPTDRGIHGGNRIARFEKRNLQRSSCSIIPARPEPRFRPHNCAPFNPALAVAPFI